MQQPATVLLVDDDPSIIDLAATFIERANEDLETTTATTPTAALERIEDGDIECVVSDYDMPEMDGLALFEAVAERHSELPFILFTGKGSEEVASEALSLGITDYLQKETGTEQYEVLANRIQNAIEARRAQQQLERAEERYGRVVEASPAGIVITTPGDNIVYVNDVAVSFIGADNREDLYGVSTMDLIHPDDEAKLRERWRESRKGNPQPPTEERFVGFDGETRYALVASTPVSYEGEPAMQSVLIDITEQRRAEAALREEREFTERALNTLDDIFYALDQNGELLRWNDQLAAVTGYTDEEIGNMYPADFFAEEDRDRVGAAITAVIENGHASVEATVETKHGERIPYEFLGTELTDDGETVGLCGMGRDLTERRERELELERYERTVAAVDDALYTVDSEGCFTTVNDSFVALTGYDHDVVLGSNVSILKDEETVALFEDNVRELLRGDHDETYVEFELRTATGETVRCEDHMALRTDEGEYAGVAGVIRDITARKQRERDLERYETAIKAAPVGVFVLDAEGTIVWSNGRAAASVEHTTEELSGKPFHSLVEAGIVSEDASENYADILRDLLSHDTDHTTGLYETTVMHSDGSEHTIGISVSLLPYEDAFRGSVLVTRDVTERRERTERLNAQATAMDASMDGMAIMGSDEEYIYVNEAHASIYGYDDPKSLLGRSWRDLYDSEECERIEATAFAALEETGSWRGEAVGRHADGTTFPQELSLTALEDGGIVCVIRDITERAKRQRTIERERDRLNALFENVSAAVFRYDTEDGTGHIREVNAAFERTFGYDEADVVGKPIRDAIVPPDRMEDYEKTSASADRGEPIDAEVERRTANGTRTFLLRNAPLGEAGGEDETAGYAIYTDITARKQRERELERYETAIEVAPVGVFLLGTEGTVQWCNQRGGAFVGHAADDLMGEPFVSLVKQGIIPEDSPAEYAEVLRDLLSTGNDRTAGTYEIPLTLPDDTHRTLRAHVSLLPYDEEFEGTVLVAEDITERKHRQRDLERERERFATLFENIPDPAVFVEHIGTEITIRSVNDAFETTFGYSAETAVGASLNDLIVPPERRAEAEELDTAVANGERIVREVCRRTEASEEREFLFRNATIDGEGTEAFGVYTDITAQKRRERVLTALHDRTREMMELEDPEAIASIAVEAAADVLDLPTCGVWLYDEETTTLVPTALTEDGNAVVEDIPTYEPGNSLSWTAFAEGETRTYGDVREAEAYNPETPIRSEMILPLGEYGVMNIGSATPDGFDDTDETLASLLATNVEAALERAERERERAVQKRLLERQNQRLDEFAGVVSHDLRNPLTVAGGRLELLADESDSPHIPPIHDALDRMDDLIDESLTFARQGKVVTDPEPIDVEEVVERAWKTVETGTVELHVGKLGGVEGDDERLRRLFENLFRNAFEHANPTTIRVGSLDDRPGFYVADDGPGIPDSAREDVFERGYSTNQNGTGLGLAIVETLAEAHGWTVEVADTDTGARFEVFFEPTDPIPAQ